MSRTKCMSLIAAAVAAACLFSIPAGAAVSGAQGYAIYRDGVAAIEWHAALMELPSASMTLPIVHHSGSGKVTYCQWGTFLDGKNFMGVYKPKVNLTDSSRFLAVSTAREMVSANIGYTLTNQVNFKLPEGGYIRVPDIVSVRCDGVVEYCYEWNNLRVYGSDSLWDVSRRSLAIYNHHGGILVTPKKQAQSYLTRVSTVKP